MNEIDDSLLRKIKNIQELAQRGGTKAEAEAAAGKLTELLLKHNLTLLDLDQVSDERGTKVSEQLFWLSAVSNWRRELLNQVARANGCRILIYPRTTACNIIGYSHNIIVTVNFYQWLESIFEDIVKEERDRLKYRKDWPSFDSMWDLDLLGYVGIEMEIERLEQSRRMLMQSSQQWGKAFRYGLVAGIADKMKQARKKVQAEAGDKWALVPLMEREVDDYIDAKNVKSQQTKITLNRAAQEHGYRRGQRVNVDPQVSGGGANLSLRG